MWRNRNSMFGAFSRHGRTKRTGSECEVKVPWPRIELLVERVNYDGDRGNISITFRPSGVKTLVGELAKRKEEAA